MCKAENILYRTRKLIQVQKKTGNIAQYIQVLLSVDYFVVSKYNLTFYKKILGIIFERGKIKDKECYKKIRHNKPIFSICKRVCLNDVITITQLQSKKISS